MTDIGIENIKTRIKDMAVDLPIGDTDELNSDRLYYWLIGYRACEQNVLSLLDGMKDGYR